MQLIKNVKRMTISFIFIIFMCKCCQVSTELEPTETAISVIGHQMCKKQCIRYSSAWCSSYRYRMDTFTCYLGQNFTSSTTSIQRTGQRTDISSSTNGSCVGHNCGPKEKCVILHGGTPKCVIFNCGTPLQQIMANLTSSTGGDTVSSVRTYSCTDDFAMIGTPTMICMASGDWKINFICATELRLHTIGYNYVLLDESNIDVANSTQLVFDVQSCFDAHIGLFAQLPPSQSDMYEIVLGAGGNTYNVIRDEMLGGNLVGNSGSYLNCSQREPFWIQWEDGKIRVGTGYNVGESTFLEYYGPLNYEINYAGVAGYATTTGNWSFYKE